MASQSTELQSSSLTPPSSSLPLEGRLDVPDPEDNSILDNVSPALVSQTANLSDSPRLLHSPRPLFPISQTFTAARYEESIILPPSSPDYTESSDAHDLLLPPSSLPGSPISKVTRDTLDESSRNHSSPPPQATSPSLPDPLPEAHSDSILLDIPDDADRDNSSSRLRCTMSSPGPSMHLDECLHSSSPQPSSPSHFSPRKRAVSLIETDADEADAQASKPSKRQVRFFSHFEPISSHPCVISFFFFQRLDDVRSSPPRSSTPNPKRPTLASQLLSHKKLSTPFRSPLTSKTATAERQVKLEDEPSTVHHPASLSRKAPIPTVLNVRATIAKQALASRAANQFKSPLAQLKPSDGSRTVILPTPKIQALERRMTLLKRALKIQREGDEDHLAELAMKWRDAGREAAYELWELVRDMAKNDEDASGASKGSQWGWGWEEGDKKDEEGDETMSVGKDETEAESETKEEETLGLMLRKLGIAPETLGWNEESETFEE